MLHFTPGHFVVGFDSPRFLYNGSVRYGKVEKVTANAVTIDDASTDENGNIRGFRSYRYEKMYDATTALV